MRICEWVHFCEAGADRVDAAAASTSSIGCLRTVDAVSGAPLIPSRRGRTPRIRRIAGAALAAIFAVSLAACTPDQSTEDFLDGANKDYIAADGFRTVEIAPEERGETVVYGGTVETGERFDSADAAGQVVVVNFWYAGCPPCRLEAPELEAVWQEFQDQDVTFMGVNTRDQPETALSFADTYDVTYPSLMDAATGEAKLAFAAVVPVQATPTTVVLDREGRVAARIIGAIPRASILSSIVKTVVAETP